jgi:hypothetical protein
MGQPAETAYSLSHPERSEVIWGKGAPPPAQILRFAQDDDRGEYRKHLKLHTDAEPFP